MAKTIYTKYGVFDVIASLSCMGCCFSNSIGENCKRPSEFGTSCTIPTNVIFQPSDNKRLTEDKKYHIIEHSGCGGCCFLVANKPVPCTKPSIYPNCTASPGFKSSIFKPVISELKSPPEASTLVGKKWNLIDGKNFVIAAKAKDHNSCTGCCFESDCLLYSDLGDEYIDCSAACNDVEIIFLLNGMTDTPYIRAIEPHQDILGDLLTIKHDGLVRIARSTGIFNVIASSGCMGCWFSTSSGCSKQKWKYDKDFPGDCFNIIFTMERMPEHSDPDWIDSEKLQLNEVLRVNKFALLDGNVVEAFPMSACEGCYFDINNECKQPEMMSNKIKFDCTGQQFRLVNPIEIECDEDIMPVVESSNTSKFSIDIGIIEVKLIPNMSLKEQCKFLI